MLLRARIVIPVTAPPLEDGAVLISRGRITAVGPWRELARSRTGRVLDLGEVILLPGLVNAHCHLDYTRLAGQLAPPKTFPDWIKAILTAKGTWTDDDFAASWREGARQLVESGTTTVANIESQPALLGRRRRETPLRVHSFLELTGVRSRRPAAEIIREAERVLARQTAHLGGVGLSPHAPYSTMPELLAAAAASAARRNWPVTTHVAESEAEFDMFMYRRGPMFTWLERERPMADCGLGSPVQHLARHGLLTERFLAVHVNYLWHGDASALGSRGASVVHCPQSHAYFGHRRFPREELEAAGVNVCLGTDSLASTKVRRGNPPALSMFDEMRSFAARDTTLDAAGILTRATVNGAHALGLRGLAGELTPGSRADLCVIASAPALPQCYEAVITHTGRAAATMIAGQWVWAGEALRNQVHGLRTTTP